MARANLTLPCHSNSKPVDVDTFLGTDRSDTLCDYEPFVSFDAETFEQQAARIGIDMRPHGAHARALS